MAKIRDVARHAGVSAMTVSRARNEPDRVSPETRARVLGAVEALVEVRRILSPVRDVEWPSGLPENTPPSTILA